MPLRCLYGSNRSGIAMHDRRGYAVVLSLIPVAPRTIIVKIADLLPPSHWRRGAIEVFVRHKPQWHRHDRRGSAVVPSLIAVAPRKTLNTADLRGGTAKTLNMFKTSAGPPRVGPISVRSPRHRHYRRGTAMTAVAPYNDRSSTSTPAVPPQHNRRAIAIKYTGATYGDPVAFLLRLWRCYHGATTALAPQCCRQQCSHAANDRRGTAIKPEL